MKPDFPGTRAGGPRGGSVSVLFKVAGLLGVVGLAIALSSLALKDDPAAVSPRAHWYFRLEQWRADAQTIAAAWRYLLQDETLPKPISSGQPFVVATTNSGPTEPKA